MDEVLLIKLKLFFPGLVGALLAAMTGPKRNKVERFVGFLFGCFAAVYGTEPVMDFFGLKAVYSNMMCFVLGYLSMAMAEAVMRTLRDVNFMSIIEGIGNIFGKKFGG